MRTVTVQLRADNVIGTTDRRLFGAFIEHLGPTGAAPPTSNRCSR